MFTRADADHIRSRLGEPFTNQQPLPQSEVFASYFLYYGFSESAVIQASTHSAGILQVGDDELVIQSFRPDSASTKGTVFLLHGYLDHVGIYKHIIAHCLATGFQVVMFDQAGHGLSTGEPAGIASFDLYSQALSVALQKSLEVKLENPWHVIGQSTGGAVIVDSLLKGYPELGSMVTSYTLLAPLLRPYAWGKSRVLFAASQWFLASTKRTFSENSHDEEFLKFLRDDDPLQSRFLKRDWIRSMINYQKDFKLAEASSVPLTIIQGTDDTTVDWQYNIPRFKEKFPKASVHDIDGGRHHLVNESESYRSEVFKLLDAALLTA